MSTLNKYWKVKDISRVAAANKGSRNGNWQGGEWLDGRNRYHVWLNDNLKMKRSRFIAESCIERPLKKEEVVHHLNGDKSDDRPENLYIFPNQSAHYKHHRSEDIELRSNL